MALVGEMSQALKTEHFIVSLVPPQSYLDVESPHYDRNLNHAYPNFHPEFKYHGANVYALWVAKYGITKMSPLGSSAVEDVATFDIIDVQLYEGFSRAGAAIMGGMDPATYIVNWARAIQKGWMVNFANDPTAGLNNTIVRVPASQLVVGFSHGAMRAPHEKSIFIPPAAVAKAWAVLAVEERPKGVMFWNMDNDGSTCWFPDGHTVNVSFAASFNAFLRTRQ